MHGKHSYDYETSVKHTTNLKKGIFPPLYQEFENFCLETFKSLGSTNTDG